MSEPQNTQTAPTNDGLIRKETNTDNVKELADAIIKLQKEHQKTVEKNSADIKSLAELFKKTESEDKLARDPLVDEKLKKMNDQLTAFEDKYKNLALKYESEKRFKTVDGLAEHLVPNYRKSSDKIDRYKLAKSILEDPHSEEYSYAFNEVIKSAFIGAYQPEASRKMSEVISKVKNSSYDKEESFIKKALTTIIGDQAGYLAPPEFELAIEKEKYETSPLRQVATSRMTTRGVYEWPIRTTLPTTYWGNTQLGTQKTEEQKYHLGKIPINDLNAEPELAHNLIEDAAVNIEAELRMDLVEAFTLAENRAFIQGRGSETAQPMGLHYYAGKSATTYDRSEPLQMERREIAHGSFAADNLLNLEAALFSQFKQRAVWLINRTVKNTIRQFKDMQGAYLFSERQGWGGFQGVPKIMDGINGQIIGYPILECDDLDGVGSNTYPVYFGDFSKYYIVDRIGLTLIRDEVTKKGFIVFWFRKRLGAGFKTCQGVKVLKTTG